ncbi:MAG: cytidine deaminase [Anaerolineae bacterium]|nr:cytidine deaminase [Anaerolineae bacterium]
MALDHATRQQLIAAALEVRQRAYAPYSKYRVGAALLAADGTVFSGCNVENASYGATICAERGAVMQGVSAGQRHFTAIAIATSNGGSPCGICRQVLYEFGPEMTVILVNDAGEIRHEGPLDALLPLGFGPDQLS